jgi:hypothetical protein
MPTWSDVTGRCVNSGRFRAASRLGYRDIAVTMFGGKVCGVVFWCLGAGGPGREVGGEAREGKELDPRP